jgi:hypothetical protein
MDEVRFAVAAALLLAVVTVVGSVAIRYHPRHPEAPRHVRTWRLTIRVVWVAAALAFCAYAVASALQTPSGLKQWRQQVHGTSRSSSSRWRRTLISDSTRPTGSVQQRKPERGQQTYE